MPLRYHNGDAFGFTYNGEEYCYIKNVQNDIVAIADKNGDIVANYYYGALIDGVAGGGYGYNKAVKSNIPKDSVGDTLLDVVWLVQLLEV